MYCSKCGAKLPEDARFCVNCGNKAITEVQIIRPKRTGCLKWLLIPIGLFFALILIAVISAAFNDTPNVENDIPADADTESTLVQETEIVEEPTPELDSELESDPEPEPAVEGAIETLPGETKDNPIVITVDVLVEEINADIDSAKEKYNGKWIQITGDVVSYYTVAGMTGYYLYGDRGVSGLRIICWCDGDPYKSTMLGEIYTFVGIMREVTTFNATEIGECEIVVE